MPLATETIGTGETYTTINSWENALPATLDKIYTGQCKGESFSAAFLYGTTPAIDKYAHLTAVDGDEHDGRAHEVSASGNARIEYEGATWPLRLEDEYLRVSWMEVKGPGNNAYNTVNTSAYLSSSTIYVHHCIFHNNDASSSTINYGIQFSDEDSVGKIYRNVIYGVGAHGISALGVAGSAVLCNTIYQCNNSGSAYRGGIACGTDYLVQANACFDNSNKDLYNTNGTQDYNATSDGTGDDEGANGIANLTTADQFTNPTTTWANTDLTIKAGSDLIDAGTSFSAETYPEINVPITTRGTTITGDWDIGADEYVAAGGNAMPMAMIHYSRRRSA